MKNNFAKKIVKILTIAIFSVFVLTLFNFEIVKAEYEYDPNLSIKENYEKAGRLDLYQTFLNELEEENQGKQYDPNSYEGKAQEILNRESEYIIKDGEYQGSTDGEKFTYTLLQELPKEGGSLKTNVTLKEYLTWAFRFTLALAGFLAVMMIVIGGVEYIISGANEASRSDAKKRINNAISGLVLALVSYLVLYTINPSLVDFENNQFFKKKTTTSSGSNSDDGNDNTDDGNNNTDNGIDIIFPDNEGSSGTIKDSAQDTYQKQDGDYSYSVKRTKETVEYEDGTAKYRTLERYTDKNKDNHFVVSVKDAQGNDIFLGESVEYFDNDGNYEEIKFFKGGKEVELSDFNYE